MVLFKTESKIEFKELKTSKPKDEVQEILEIYIYLRGKYNKEFDNDLLDFLEKVIKRNKK